MLQPMLTFTFQLPEIDPSQQGCLALHKHTCHLHHHLTLHQSYVLLMKDYPGTDVHSLRRLATSMAREAIFGKKEMQQSSPSGKNSMGSFDVTKFDYIKNVVR